MSIKVPMSFLTRLLISVVISLIIVLLVLFSLFRGVLKTYFYEIENYILDEKVKILMDDLTRGSELFYYKILSSFGSDRKADIVVHLSDKKEIIEKARKVSVEIIERVKDLNFSKRFGVIYLNSKLFNVAILNKDRGYVLLFKRVNLEHLWFDKNLKLYFSHYLPSFVKKENFVFHKKDNIYYAFSINTLDSKKVFGIFKGKFFLCEIINKIFWTEVFFFVMSFLACVFLIICFNSRILIKTINNISNKLKSIADLNDLSKRIEFSGIKEIDALTKNINMFLDKLERSYTDFKTTMDLYYKLIEKSSEVIFLFDLQTKKIIHYNEAFKNLFLYDDEDIKKLTIYDLPADDLADKNLDRVRKGEHYLGERPYKRKDGTIVYVEVISYFINVQGRELVSVLVRDVTKQKMEREYIIYMAYHDVLTGLLNRRYVLKELGDLLSGFRMRRKSPKKVTIVMVDLDGFKRINDTYGHHAGDRVLKEVASRFKKSLRGSDIIGRLGGDEFLIVLPDILPESVPFVLNKILSVFKEPIKIDGKQIQIGFSMGVCICPDDGIDPDEVLKKADKAMYYAKRTNKDWVFYKEL